MYEFIFNKKLGMLFKNRIAMMNGYFSALQINIKQMLKLPLPFSGISGFSFQNTLDEISMSNIGWFRGHILLASPLD